MGEEEFTPRVQVLIQTQPPALANGDQGPDLALCSFPPGVSYKLLSPFNWSKGGGARGGGEKESSQFLTCENDIKLKYQRP